MSIGSRPKTCTMCHDTAALALRAEVEEVRAKLVTAAADKEGLEKLVAYIYRCVVGQLGRAKGFEGMTDPGCLAMVGNAVNHNVYGKAAVTRVAIASAREALDELQKLRTTSIDSPEYDRILGRVGEALAAIPAPPLLRRNEKPGREKGAP